MSPHHRSGKKPFIARNRAEWLAENAQNLWEYTGEGSGLIWKIKRPGSRGKGFEAGGKQLRYYAVRYEGKYYFCHHIVWTLFNGLIPECSIIDHKDRNGHNNKIENLSLKTTSQNSQNKAPVGASGYRGVSWFARDRKWLARLGTESGYKFLGYYEEQLDAALVWDKAAKANGRPPECLNFPELYDLY